MKKQRGNIHTVLHKGGGGQFEVVLDGQLIFSKKERGRFPTADEILKLIPAA